MKKKVLRSIVSLSLTLVFLLSFNTSIYAAGVATTSSARIYSTFSAFKASPAYNDTDYNPIMKLCNATYTTVIPGLKTTNVGGTACTSMTPQGMCFAGDYMLMSAYDSKEVQNSVIYVLKESDHSYICTIQLPFKRHVGGLAYSSTDKRIFVSNGNYVSSFTYDRLDKAAKDKQDCTNFVDADLKKSSKLACAASYITFSDGVLWVGYFDEDNLKANCSLYGYKVNSGALATTPQYSYASALPPKTQGISIRDGKIYASTSYGRNSDSKLYVYNFANKVGSKVGECLLPPMSEAVVVGKTYTYVLFESAAYKYHYQDSTNISETPVDRAIAVKTASLLSNLK